MGGLPKQCSSCGGFCGVTCEYGSEEMKEAGIQLWVRKELEKIYDDNLVYIKYPASQYCQRGVADLLFCIYGLYVAIEVKTDTGKPTKLQERFGKKVQDAGGYFTFIYGKDQRVIDQLRTYVANHRIPK